MVKDLTERFSAVTPLALVLKQFLADRGLDQSYSGGLSSYCLILLITRILQHEHHHGRPINQAFADAYAMLENELTCLPNDDSTDPKPTRKLLSKLIPSNFNVVVINQFSRVAQNERCSFLGNVCLGSSITLPELRDMYNAVVLAYGAESDRSLGIPGEVYMLPESSSGGIMGIQTAELLLQI